MTSNTINYLTARDLKNKAFVNKIVVFKDKQLK